jgi:hypothetical protein
MGGTFSSSFFLIMSLFNWPIYKTLCISKIRTPKIEVFGWVVCSTKSIVLQSGMFFQFYRHQTRYVPHA